MASFRDQLVPIISQGLERFANSTLDRVTNNIPFSTNGIVSGRPSQKYSTEKIIKDYQNIKRNFGGI